MMLPGLDVSQMPAAGSYRQRSYEPRELLARSGSQTVACPLHPKFDVTLSEKFRCPEGQIGYDRVPEPNRMFLSRTPPKAQLDASAVYEMPAGMRAAGIPCSMQTAKTRAEFKSHAVHGQFSNELISSIPETRLKFQSVRADTAVYAPHQKSTTSLRMAMQRSGQL
eukprot:TRINITY_DN36968_c0_g1_i1.p1 TRINITY_DN36968_c0_g1~~TRINITY_DN36968_c0_g1_i1.p1  ORF type:complete len:166 (+),score=21.50 TRINITY_DN36968_c0_g1_i1:125-622(+)